MGNRITKRLNTFLDKDYRATFFERIECLKKAGDLYADLPRAVRYGKTLEYILKNITVFVQEEELILGSVKEIIPSDEQYNMAIGMEKEWWGGVSYEEKQRRISYYFSEVWIKSRPPWFFSLGHLGIDWEELIREGISFYKAKAEKNLENKEVLTEAQINFNQGALICCDAISAYIKRHEEVATLEAKKTKDPVRAKEIEDMGIACANICEYGAKTFREAIQLIWLVSLVMQKICGCGVLDFGRMDQYLYPYYQRDIESGIETDETLTEVLAEFFFKNNEIMVPSADHMSEEDEKVKYNIEFTFDDSNYIIIGGLLYGDKPGVNRLSYLMIEATRKIKGKNPWLILRYYKGIEDDFLKLACEAVRENCTIIFYNDITMLSALPKYGIEKKDAYEYGFYGCNDPHITGIQNGLRQVWFNMVLPLTLALNEGKNPLNKDGKEFGELLFSLKNRMIGIATEPYDGMKTKSVDEMTCFEDVLEAYKQQTRYLTGKVRLGIEHDLKIENENNKGNFRIEDIFLHGTMKNLTDWNYGGTKYHHEVFQGCGFATAVDSLAAIKQVVFNEKQMTLRELVDRLNNNYADDLVLKDYLDNKCGKFGNDIEWVDNIATIVSDIFCDATMEFNGEEYLYQLWPTLSTDRGFTEMGEILPATPDGRAEKDPISENQSPSTGKDVTGLTALLNSVSKINFEKLTGGPLNIKIHPSAVKGEIGLEVMKAAFKTYFDNKGMQIQINIMSSEQLIEAQKNPEKYKSLCVRVVGYSAYFVQMGKKAQEEMIQRTEFH